MKLVIPFFHSEFDALQHLVKRFGKNRYFEKRTFLIFGDFRRFLAILAPARSYSTISPLGLGGHKNDTKSILLPNKKIEFWATFAQSKYPITVKEKWRFHVFSLQIFSFWTLIEKNPHFLISVLLFGRKIQRKFHHATNLAIAKNLTLLGYIQRKV